MLKSHPCGCNSVDFEPVLKPIQSCMKAFLEENRENVTFSPSHCATHKFSGGYRVICVTVCATRGDYLTMYAWSVFNNSHSVFFGVITKHFFLSAKVKWSCFLSLLGIHVKNYWHFQLEKEKWLKTNISCVVFFFLGMILKLCFWVSVDFFCSSCHRLREGILLE